MWPCWATAEAAGLKDGSAFISANVFVSTEG